MGTIRRTIDRINRTEYQTGVKWQSVFFDDFFTLDTVMRAPTTGLLAKDTIKVKWRLFRDDTCKGVFVNCDTSHGVQKFISSSLDVSGTAGVNMQTARIVFLEKGHPVKFEAFVKVDSARQTSWTIGFMGTDSTRKNLADSSLDPKYGAYFYKPTADTNVYIAVMKDSIPAKQPASQGKIDSCGDSTMTRFHVPPRFNTLLDTAYATRTTRLFSDFNRFTIIYDGGHTLFFEINGNYVGSDTTTARMPYGKGLRGTLDFRSGVASKSFRYWIDYVEILDRRITAEDYRSGSGEVYQTTP